MDGGRLSSQGGSIDTRSGSTPVLGCYSVGVGCTPPRLCRVRGVVGAEVAAHQSSRNEGNVSGVAVISGVGRRVTVMCDNSADMAYVNKLGRMVSHSLCSLASRLLRWTESLDVHLDARYPAGQSNVLADLLSHRDQVIGIEWSLHPQVARDLLRHWGLSSIDLFATSLNSQHEAAPILFPRPGSPGDLRGCVSSSLGQPGPVRVSTLSSGRKGSGSSQRDSQSLHDSGCPPLAGEGLVRQPSTSTDPATFGASVVGPVVETSPLQQVPPRCPHAEPSHVATLQCLLRRSGFSQGSAVEMSGYVSTSNSRLYQAKWMLFCGWCRGRGVAPVNDTVPMIVDFLVHLRRDKGLSVSAVKGHRAALNSVFALKGIDLADSCPISMLIRSFSKSVRPEELRPHAWDITLDLQSLTRVPYKLLQTSD